MSSEENNVILEFKNNFHALPRVERELCIIDLLKGIHSLTESMLAATTNQSFMAVLSANMDSIIDNPEILDKLINILVAVDTASVTIKSDIDDAISDDYKVKGLVHNIKNSFKSLRGVLNKVMLPSTSKISNRKMDYEESNGVLHVNFRKK